MLKYIVICCNTACHFLSFFQQFWNSVIQMKQQAIISLLRSMPLSSPFLFDIGLIKNSKSVTRESEWHFAWQIDWEKRKFSHCTLRHIDIFMFFWVCSYDQLLLHGLYYMCTFAKITPICRQWRGIKFIRNDWSRSVLVLELQDQDFTGNLEAKTSAIWSRGQDLSHLVSRPRPWSPGLETETKTLAYRSRVNSSSRP